MICTSAAMDHRVKPGDDAENKAAESKARRVKPGHDDKGRGPRLSMHSFLRFSLIPRALRARDETAAA